MASITRLMQRLSCDIRVSKSQRLTTSWMKVLMCKEERPHVERLKVNHTHISQVGAMAMDLSQWTKSHNSHCKCPTILSTVKVYLQSEGVVEQLTIQVTQICLGLIYQGVESDSVSPPIFLHNLLSLVPFLFLSCFKLSLHIMYGSIVFPFNTHILLLIFFYFLS